MKRDLRCQVQIDVAHLHFDGGRVCFSAHECRCGEHDKHEKREPHVANDARYAPAGSAAEIEGRQLSETRDNLRRMKVFISYRRDDTAGHAGRLHDSLQSHFGADNVFMDLSDIDSGQNFVDVIHTAVRSSDVLLAIIGKQWLTCTTAGTRRLDMPKDFVRTEIGVALEHGVPVIPVLVQGAGMPLAPSLPEPLKPLASHDAHDLSDERWSYDVGRLIEATEKLAGKRPLEAMAARRGRRRRCS